MSSFKTILSSKETDGELSIVKHTVDPGDGPPMHTHTQESEFFRVVSGEIEFQEEGKEPVTLRRDQCFVGRPGIPHRFKNVSSTTAVLDLMFVPGGFESYFAELHEARKTHGPDLRDREAQIDRKYGIIIERPI